MILRFWWQTYFESSVSYLYTPPLKGFKYQKLVHMFYKTFIKLVLSEINSTLLNNVQNLHKKTLRRNY